MANTASQAGTYFVLYPEGGGYGLSGEGSGKKAATEPAFNELKALGPIAIRELLAEAQKSVR